MTNVQYVTSIWWNYRTKPNYLMNTKKRKEETTSKYTKVKPTAAICLTAYIMNWTNWLTNDKNPIL